jgi:ABC-2 type transport system permease protein
MSGKKSSFHYLKLQPSVAAKKLDENKENGILILKLDRPLPPGDSLTFDFDFKYIPSGVFGRINSPVVDNGTFFNNDLLPSFGYNISAELSENAARKEYGLPAKPRLPDVNDSAALMNNYISSDADWVRFEATLSTKEGQMAIAPGYLQKDWKKDGRHYFNYKMDNPILNFYSFLSAEYKLKKDKWKDVNIEIYYHEGHTYNIDRMISSIKKSLDYYSAEFGPYQHKQVRILEFPRYASFAQSFPNTIPYSEGIGFILKVDDDPDKIDIPFYVTAHEMAHQWWAHQVIGGNVQGSVLMSETMSQYAALMVMEKTYGRPAMRKFLKYEMDKYLQGRAFESMAEMPLMLCENQQYIHYNKGSVVMYALKDMVGEKTLNRALRNYLNANKYQGPPYTNSVAFVNAIRGVTPDSMQYLVSDLFERITLYENYVGSLESVPLPDGNYRVRFTVGSAKFYADSLGAEKKAEVNDYMDIAIFGQPNSKSKDQGKELLIQRIKMDKPEKSFEFIVKEKPAKVGIDPYLTLIDRTPENNICEFGKKPLKPSLESAASKSLINYKIEVE